MHKDSINIIFIEKSVDNLEVPSGFGPSKGISMIDLFQSKNDVKRVRNEKIHLESLAFEYEEDGLEEARRTYIGIGKKIL